MKWKFFVLAFDCTYDNEDPYGFGVKPRVYLIPEYMEKDVEKWAEKTYDVFCDAKSDDCIADVFETYLSNAGINFRIVGDINLTFGERDGIYLSNEISYECI